jgi:catechol 2,3-dioxygenase-like lactoylglutathione lyase family enzyme
MSNAHYFILYVDNPPASTAFYQDLLGKPPVDASPGFALFALDSGVMLGLWARAAVHPPVSTPGIEGEIAFKVDDSAAVDKTHAGWRSRGVNIVQPPNDLDFGRSFTALDPDGHRLRVFAPPAA